MALPPWLQINPRDYLAAVESGTRAGLSIRQASEQAWESAQRMQMEQQAQQQRQQQLGVENQQNRLAQERLEAFRKAELDNAQKRIGVSEEGVGLREQGLKNAQERAQESLAAQKERADALQSQRDFQNQMSGKLLDLKNQTLLDKEGKSPKGHYETVKGKLYWASEDDPTNLKPVNPPETKAAPGGSLLKTLGNADLGAIKFGGKLALGMNPLQDFLGAAAPSATNSPTGTLTAPAAAANKKRIRVKGPSGQSGTIEGGDKLPDGWSTAE